MGRYCDNCDNWSADGDGWGKCKKQGYKTTKGSESCGEWKQELDPSVYSAEGFSYIIGKFSELPII